MNSSKGDGVGEIAAKQLLYPSDIYFDHWGMWTYRNFHDEYRILSIPLSCRIISDSRVQFQEVVENITPGISLY